MDAQGAHTYKHNAKISTELQKRQEGLPKEINDISWQAMPTIQSPYAQR